MFKYLCLNLSLLSALDTSAMCCGLGKSERQKRLSECLIVAVVGNSPAEVDKLLQAGADVNLVGKCGLTPLIAAVDQGQVAMVEKLLNAKAQIDATSQSGSTPLMWAATRVDNRDCKAIVKILLNNGAKTHLVNKDKKTALELAEKKYATGVVRLIGPRARWENGDGNRVAWVTACVVIAARQALPAGAGVGIASRSELAE